MNGRSIIFTTMHSLIVSSIALVNLVTHTIYKGNVQQFLLYNSLRQQGSNGLWYTLPEVRKDWKRLETTAN